VLKKINATGNPGCTLFNSKCTISAKNTLRIGPGVHIGAICSAFCRAHARYSLYFTVGRICSFSRYPREQTDRQTYPLQFFALLQGQWCYKYRYRAVTWYNRSSFHQQLQTTILTLNICLILITNNTDLFWQSSLASFKSRLVLPFRYRLKTQVVPLKRPLNGCCSSSSNKKFLFKAL